MPVLNAFIAEGRIRSFIDDDVLLASWKKFYAQNANFKDLERVRTRADFEAISDRHHFKTALQNPVHFLAKSGRGFFTQDPPHTLSLSSGLEPWLNNPTFIEHFADAVEYKTLYYYETRYAAKEHPEVSYERTDESLLQAADSGECRAGADGVVIGD